jgi:hypothetical protein
MHATVRRYKGIAPGAVAELTRRRADVEAVLKGVPGLVTYHLLKTDEGITSVSVYENQAGIEEANRRVADWIKQNMPTSIPNAPEIVMGEVVMDIPR